MKKKRIKTIKSKNGRIVEEECFDVNDMPIISLELPFKRKQEFDTNENLIREMNYYGKIDSAGIAIRGSKYNKNLNPIERTYYNKNEELKNNSRGNAIVKIKYDEKDFEKEIVYYDQNKKYRGAIHFKWGDGLPYERSCYDENDKLKSINFYNIAYDIIISLDKENGKPHFYISSLMEEYKAEYEMPLKIPKTTEEFNKLFLSYMKKERDYIVEDLKNLIKWFSEKNKVQTDITNFEAIALAYKKMIELG